MRFYEGEKVYLRGLTAEDCGGEYLRFVNDAETLCYTEGIGYRPLSRPELEAYVAASSGPGQLLLGIFAKSDDAHVGNIRLSYIKPHHNNCVLGIVMAKGHGGKGYATEACLLALKHAFEVLNMNRVQFAVVSGNEAAVKLYDRVGGVREGVLRESFYHGGRYHDMIVYSVLQREYFAARRPRREGKKEKVS